MVGVHARGARDDIGFGRSDIYDGLVRRLWGCKGKSWEGKLETRGLARLNLRNSKVTY